MFGLEWTSKWIFKTFGREIPCPLNARFDIGFCHEHHPSLWHHEDWSLVGRVPSDAITVSVIWERSCVTLVHRKYFKRFQASDWPEDSVRTDVFGGARGGCCCLLGRRRKGVPWYWYLPSYVSASTNSWALSYWCWIVSVSITVITVCL